MEFDDKQKTRRFLYSKVTIILLVLIVGVLLIPGVYGMYKKSSQSAHDRADAERELNELKTREKNLSAEVEFSNTPRGTEEAIREKFDVAKDGESVIVLVDQPLAASTSQSEANVFRAVWQKLKKAF